MITLEDIKYMFKTIRKNAFANPTLYNGRYSQAICKDAYIEYLEDSIIKLANKGVQHG